MFESFILPVYDILSLREMMLGKMLNEYYEQTRYLPAVNKLRFNGGNQPPVLKPTIWYLSLCNRSQWRRSSIFWPVTKNGKFPFISRATFEKIWKHKNALSVLPGCSFVGLRYKQLRWGSFGEAVLTNSRSHLKKLTFISNFNLKIFFLFQATLRIWEGHASWT